MGVSPVRWGGFLDDALDATVGVFGESHGVAAVDRRILRPWPATKVRALIVAERGLQLFTRVHDKGAVLSDRLTDRSSLQEQDIGRAVDGLDLDRLVGLHLHGRRTRHESAGNAQRGSREEIE